MQRFLPGGTEFDVIRCGQDAGQDCPPELPVWVQQQQQRGGGSSRAGAWGGGGGGVEGVVSRGVAAADWQRQQTHGRVEGGPLGRQQRNNGSRGVVLAASFIDDGAGWKSKIGPLDFDRPTPSYFVRAPRCEGSAQCCAESAGGRASRNPRHTADAAAAAAAVLTTG